MYRRVKKSKKEIDDVDEKHGLVGSGDADGLGIMPHPDRFVRFGWCRWAIDRNRGCDIRIDAIFVGGYGVLLDIRPIRIFYNS